MNTRPRRGRIEKIVIHVNQGPDEPGGAKGLAAWLRTQPQGYQVIGDNKDVVRMCSDTMATEAAGGINDWSLNYCLIGSADQTTQQWADPYSEAELRLCAKWLSDNWVDEYDIPVVHKLRPEEVARDGIKGICGHLDVNLSGRKGSMWPGGHYDPGYNFPWTHFLALLNNEVQPKPEDEMKVTDTAGTLANDSGGTGLLLAGGRLIVSGSFKHWGDLTTEHAVVVMGKNHATDFEFDHDEEAYWISQWDGGLHAYGPKKTYKGNFMQDIGPGQGLAGIVLGGNDYPKGVRYPDAKLLTAR